MDSRVSIRLGFVVLKWVKLWDSLYSDINWLPIAW